MVDFETITQRQLEEYYRNYRELGGGSDNDNPIQDAGASVRAAVKVKWIDEMDVDAAKPKDIMKIATDISFGINSILGIDKKK